ncbi:ComEA family DNA-binding protein [Nitratifractor sp.]
MKKSLLGVFCLLGLLGASVDINNASVKELSSLKGIGETKAKAIIKYRKTHCFTKAEDLMQVKGIGVATFKKNRDEITVGKCRVKK